MSEWISGLAPAGSGGLNYSGAHPQVNSHRDDGWFRVSTFIGHNDKIAALPSDHVRWTLMLTWAAGKLQDPIGQWQNLNHLRLCIGRPIKHLKALVRGGCLDVADDASVRCHDFAAWQTARRQDPTNVARQQRHRRKHKDLEDDVTLHNGVTRKASNAYTETETETERREIQKRPSFQLSDEYKQAIQRILERFGASVGVQMLRRAAHDKRPAEVVIETVESLCKNGRKIDDPMGLWIHVLEQNAMTYNANNAATQSQEFKMDDVGAIVRAIAERMNP